MAFEGLPAKGRRENSGRTARPGDGHKLCEGGEFAGFTPLVELGGVVGSDDVKELCPGKRRA